MVDTDASNDGLVGVLSQDQDRQEKVIPYFTKTLSKPEGNYCVLDVNFWQWLRAWRTFTSIFMVENFILAQTMLRLSG